VTVPDTATRVGWAVALVAVAVWLALVEVFWLPLRVGGILLPLSVPAAVVGNLLLVGTAMKLTRWRLVAVLPAVVWLIVVVAGMVRRPEGDLVISGRGALGSVGLAFLLLGALAAAVAVGRALATPRTRPVTPGTDPDRAHHRAGSGNGGAR
jgi:hypothetical protein